MAGWTDLRGDMATSLLTQMGESATWLSARSGESSDVAVVLYENVELLNEETGQYESRDQLHVHQDDITQPRKGDRVTINGSTYRVDRYRHDYGLWRVTLQKDAGP